MALASVAAVLSRLDPDTSRRLAGLAITSTMHGDEASTLTPSSNEIVHVAIDSAASVSISFGLADLDASAVALLDSCWRPDWSDRSNVHIWLPALPPTYEPAVISEMLRRGLDFASPAVPCHVWVCSDAALSAASALLDSSTMGPVVPGGIPESLMADVLVPDDAPVIAHHWKYSVGDETVAQLRTLLGLGLPTACLRNRDAVSSSSAIDGGPRGLCAWALTREDLSIGNLHTLEAYRGRGLAAVVLRSVVAQQQQLKRRLVAAAEAAGDAAALAVLAHVRPYCHIVVGNVASEAVVGGRAGFERAGRADWHEFMRRRTAIIEATDMSAVS